MPQITTATINNMDVPDFIIDNMVVKIKKAMDPKIHKSDYGPFCKQMVVVQDDHGDTLLDLKNDGDKPVEFIRVGNVIRIKAGPKGGPKRVRYDKGDGKGEKGKIQATGRDLELVEAAAGGGAPAAAPTTAAAAASRQQAAPQERATDHYQPPQTRTFSEAAAALETFYDCAAGIVLRKGGKLGAGDVHGAVQALASTLFIAWGRRDFTMDDQVPKPAQGREPGEDPWEHFGANQ